MNVVRIFFVFENLDVKVLQGYGVGSKRVLKVEILELLGGFGLIPIEF